MSFADFAMAVEHLAGDGARAEDVEEVSGAQAVILHDAFGKVEPLTTVIGR